MTLLSGKEQTEFSSRKIDIFQTNLTYFPRYNFVENDNSSISIGMPLGVGIAVAEGSQGSDYGILFSFDVPVAVDYNFGCKSTPDNDGAFGGYLGLGFGYHKVTISKSSYMDFNGGTYGPILRGGIRISPESFNGYGITLGLQYKKGLEKSRLNSYGIAVLADF
ncbi:MAG: hypothetical protein QM664_04020 [Flavihumibacter sp.]